jgi:hypothetical protein
VEPAPRTPLNSPQSCGLNSYRIEVPGFALCGEFLLVSIGPKNIATVTRPPLRGVNLTSEQNSRSLEGASMSRSTSIDLPWSIDRKFCPEPRPLLCRALRTPNGYVSSNQTLVLSSRFHAAQFFLLRKTVAIQGVVCD